MTVRDVVREDLQPIRNIVTGTGNFNAAEIETAVEVIEEALAGDEDYHVLVAEQEGRVRGYACYGPTPMTEGTYDLYWIAVDAGSQGHGYGKELLRHVEQRIRKENGRLLIIETSSQENYGNTIRF